MISFKTRRCIGMYRVLNNLKLIIFYIEFILCIYNQDLQKLSYFLVIKVVHVSIDLSISVF